MVIKGYSIFPKVAELEPLNQTILYHLQYTEMQSVYSTQKRWVPCGAVIKVFDLDIAVSSNFNGTITFIFGLILLEKVWTPPSYELNKPSTVLSTRPLLLLLYGCTTWTLTKRMEKKHDGNYSRMLRAILNKSGRQHPTKQQLYGHLPSITKTIKVIRTRHAGHCWRSGDELISDVLLWTPSHGRAKAGRPTRTCIQQLFVDTGCSPEDLPEAMNDREEWRERVRDIRADGTRWMMSTVLVLGWLWH